MLTELGHKNLLQEYKNLVEVQRPAIVDQIRKARELGDLSENGMYHAAREKQSFLEGRIREIEDIIKNVDVVKKVGGKNEKIQVGSKVFLETSQKKIEYHIVGGEEVNISENRISHESPLGKALLDRKVGDIVRIETPSGNVKYKVIAIS